MDPKCIILYGSFARGDFNERSDIDLIIIAPNLPKSFYYRSLMLSVFNETLDPIDFLGFTPEEFIHMIEKRNCTALFAMEEGKPLYGAKYFNFLKVKYEQIKQKFQLFKGDAAWIPQSFV